MEVTAKYIWHYIWAQNPGTQHVQWRVLLDSQMIFQFLNPSTHFSMKWVVFISELSPIIAWEKGNSCILTALVYLIEMVLTCATFCTCLWRYTTINFLLTPCGTLSLPLYLLIPVVNNSPSSLCFQVLPIRGTIESIKVVTNITNV